MQGYRICSCTWRREEEEEVDVGINDMLLFLSNRPLGMTEEDRSIKLTR